MFDQILSLNKLTKNTKGDIAVHTPIDGSLLSYVTSHTADGAKDIMERSDRAFKEWRKIPAPVRGEFVRILADELRAHKQSLGQLVTLECGKILSEGLGEVQEMIDVCDYAVGLSRQLYGLTIASERPGHHMREVWQPLGPVGVITAFNFPVAVWAWNAAIAFVCGDSVIWKPSEKTPLCALACQTIFDNAVQRFRQSGHACPEYLNQILIGRSDIGQMLVEDNRISLISATGSGRMGKSVGCSVSKRMGKVLLELGGNNAMIVAPSADLEMAKRAIIFSAVGTAGQRCTSLRRLIVHKDIKDILLPMLQKVYGSLKVGNPLDKDTLVGPLIDKAAGETMQASLREAKEQGGTILCGGDIISNSTGGMYVHPALVDMPMQSAIVHHETFAPILYILAYDELEEAIALNNAVPQGLSSCIFTTDVREAETFLSAVGSDCGIANVNIGPSGAEIGGAFGGEKETGGGRESGSDSWKAYMRRQTQTVNYSRFLPLAQGVKFDID